MFASDDDMREWVRNVGEECPEREWLLYPADVWVKNPWYSGESGPHPEDDFDDGGPYYGLQEEETGEDDVCLPEDDFPF